MNTGHFEFHAAGKNVPEALDALQRAWMKHAIEFHVEDPGGVDLQEYYGVTFIHLRNGEAARDGVVIVTREES